MAQSPKQNRLRPFRLHEWLILPELHRVSGHGQTIQIEPRLIDVLCYLAEHAGHVVSRDELIGAVWGAVIVNEESLTRAVSELRRILRDDRHQPRFIETIRKGGYRLVAPVIPAEEGAVRAAAAARITSSAEPVAAQRTLLRRLLPLAFGIAAVIIALLLLQPTSPPPPTEPRTLASVPFTTFPGEESRPAISPAGTRVAFCWGGTNGENFDIYIKQRNTERPLRLTDDPAYESNPAWSPDGTTIAFVRELGSGVGIFTVPAIGGVPRRLYVGEHAIPGIDWSPDGDWIVFAERGEPEAPGCVQRLSLATLDLEPLTDPPAGCRGDMMPAFSPDSEMIAFLRTDDLGFTDLYRMPAGGGRARRVTHGQQGAQGLDWLPDGSGIVISSMASGSHSLWRIALPGGELQPLLTRGDGAAHPSIASQTGTLVYEDIRFEKQICRVALSPSGAPLHEAEPFVDPTHGDSEPAFSPDGSRIAFTSKRTGEHEVWICRADGSGPERLTFFEGPMVGRPTWSPDGSRIAFAAAPHGYANAFVVPVDGGPVRAITAGTHNDRILGFSHDGAWLYLASDGGVTPQLWRHELDSGRTEHLTLSDCVAAKESTDGEYLYFARIGERSVWRMPIAGKEDEAEQLPIACDDLTNWAVRPEGILYVEMHETGPMAKLYEFAGGASRPLAQLPWLCRPGLTLSPDGRTLLYARIDERLVDIAVADRLGRGED